jgi:ABC-type Fe3+/spermidine/putrescine transport system ATPase subunit
VNRPAVLLLDEPLGALDLKLRKQMQVELKGIQREVGITFLYVTHDQEEALAISDRIAVMRAGRVEQIASPRAIYEAPETPFVASFVGVTNLIAGVVRGHAGGVMEVAFGGGVVRVHGATGNTGDKVVLSLRPEALRLQGANEPLPDGWAALAGELGETEYLGPVTRFTVTLSDGTPLHLMALAPPAAPGTTVAYDPARVTVMAAP